MNITVYLNDGSKHVINPIPEFWKTSNATKRKAYCQSVLVSRGVMLPNVHTVERIVFNS